MKQEMSSGKINNLAFCAMQWRLTATPTIPSTLALQKKKF